MTKQPPLTMTQVLHVGRQVALGLEAVHTRGLIHRDIKPGNLWLEDGTEGNLRILDFGLARQTDADRDADAPHTRVGAVVGTPEYMSPEQALGKPIDYRTDLYSLGMVLYQLAAGRLPFAGSTPQDFVIAHAEAQPDDLAALNQHVPSVVAETIMRLLEKDPRKRPASAREVADVLLHADETVTLTLPKPENGIKIGWPWFAAVAGLVAAVLGVGSWLLFRDHPVPVFKGHFDVALTQRDGKDITGPKEKILGGPGLLSLLKGDHVYVDSNLIQGPAAHFYIIHINTEGVAQTALS